MRMLALLLAPTLLFAQPDQAAERARTKKLLAAAALPQEPGVNRIAMLVEGVQMGLMEIHLTPGPKGLELKVVNHMRRAGAKRVIVERALLGPGLVPLEGGGSMTMGEQKRSITFVRTEAGYKVTRSDGKTRSYQPDEIDSFSSVLFGLPAVWTKMPVGERHMMFAISGSGGMDVYTLTRRAAAKQQIAGVERDVTRVDIDLMRGKAHLLIADGKLVGGKLGVITMKPCSEAEAAAWLDPKPAADAPKSALHACALWQHAKARRDRAALAKLTYLRSWSIARQIADGTDIQAATRAWEADPKGMGQKALDAILAEVPADTEPPASHEGYLERLELYTDAAEFARVGIKGSERVFRCGKINGRWTILMLRKEARDQE